MIAADPPRLLERLAALPAAAPLIARLKDSPLDVYLVGGAMRDLMLGREPRELDLLVEVDVTELIELLHAPAQAYERFGTATVTLDGFTYDLARARSEHYPRAGALPVVTPSVVAEDLARRDFTVNAIALAAFGPARGTLHAVAGALEDLEAGGLRVLHPDSFVDDPTRLLRLARYAGRLGFAAVPETEDLARAAVTGGALRTVSGHRLGAELRLAASEPEPLAVFAALAELGIDAALAPGFGLRQAGVIAEALGLLGAEPGRTALVLAGATLAMTAAERESMLTRMGFDAGLRDAVIATATQAPGLAAELSAASGAADTVVRVGSAAPETVALAGALGSGRAFTAAARWLGEWRHVRLAIAGGDLVAAGVAPGPAVGAGLRAALGAKLDGRAHGREAELAEALKAALASEP